MDDVNAFERQVAAEALHMAGPSEPVDDAAIFSTILAVQSPRWRIQSMFSATKLVVAGAIVALFGGLLLAGALTPATRTDTTPLAGAPSPTGDATQRGAYEFFGKLSTKGAAPSGSPGVIAYRYRVDQMSDPRLDGEWILVYTQSMVDFGETMKPLYHASFRMEDDDGAWQEEPNLTLEYPDGTASSRTSALTGEGAYAGLTAIAELTYVPLGHFDIRGLIIDAAVPEAPVHMPIDQ